MATCEIGARSFASLRMTPILAHTPCHPEAQPKDLASASRAACEIDAKSFAVSGFEARLDAL
jgi:hypothetical protein